MHSLLLFSFLSSATGAAIEKRTGVPAGYVAAPYYPAPHGGWTSDWSGSYTKASLVVGNMTLAEKTNLTSGTVSIDEMLLLHITLTKFTSVGHFHGTMRRKHRKCRKSWDTSALLARRPSRCPKYRPQYRLPTRYHCRCYVGQGTDARSRCSDRRRVPRQGNQCSSRTFCGSTGTQTTWR
jgi:hypothetical protein